MSKKVRNGVAAGATVLIAANFIVKIIGVVYKIPLANILGSEGMGYLSSAYEVYQLLLSIFTSGGTLAISKLIAESIALDAFANARKIRRVMLVAFCSVGLLGTGIMFFGAELFGAATSKGAIYCMRALSPAIFFLCLSAVYRGYYQGLQNMRPTALSPVIEALFKLSLGVGLAILVKNLGYSTETVAAAGISGTAISTAVGTTVMLIIFLSASGRRTDRELAKKGGPTRPSWEIVKSFAAIGIPLAVSSMIVNLTGVLDLFLIYDRLEAIGMTEAAANVAYGGYKGYAQPLFNLPPSIIASINIIIIPAMSVAFVKNETERVESLARRAVKIVTVLALPCAVGLIVLAGPIQRLLFPARLDQLAVTTPLLRILGAASFWVCLASLSTALMQSTGHMRLPLITLAVGGGVKLVTNYVLVGIPEIGIVGAPIGTLLCYMTMFGMNFVFLRRKSGLKLGFLRSILPPLAASAIMGVGALGAYVLLERITYSAVATVLAIVVAVGVYALSLMIFKGLDESDIRLLPKGGLIVKVFKKLKLLKNSD